LQLTPKTFFAEFTSHEENGEQKNFFVPQFKENFDSLRRWGTEDPALILKSQNLHKNQWQDENGTVSLSQLLEDFLIEK